MTVFEYLDTPRTPQDPPHLYVQTPMGRRLVLQVNQWRYGFRVVYLAQDTNESIHMDVLGNTELLEEKG